MAPRASCGVVQPWEELRAELQCHPAGNSLPVPFPFSLLQHSQSVFYARHCSGSWRNRNKQDGPGHDLPAILFHSFVHATNID